MKTGNKKYMAKFLAMQQIIKARDAQIAQLQQQLLSSQNVSLATAAPPLAAAAAFRKPTHRLSSASSGCPSRTRHGMTLGEGDVAHRTALTSPAISFFIVLGRKAEGDQVLRRHTHPQAGGRWRPQAARIGGIAMHCAGIFSCTKSSVWPAGGK